VATSGHERHVAGAGVQASIGVERRPQTSMDLENDRIDHRVRRCFVGVDHSDSHLGQDPSGANGHVIEHPAGRHGPAMSEPVRARHLLHFLGDVSASGQVGHGGVDVARMTLQADPRASSIPEDRRRSMKAGDQIGDSRGGHVLDPEPPGRGGKWARAQRDGGQSPETTV
jgi:hypothetical protein